MIGPGPLALIGGGEHLPGMIDVERRLIELTGVSVPRVVLITAAPAQSQIPKTAALARNYWSRLGASVTIVTPSTEPERALDSMATADIAVLPGGHPNKLVANLGASVLTDVLIARWAGGMAVSGSSAGAMAMFEWRINLYPPNPLKPIAGLGLLDGYVVAPHFDRFRAVLWARKALRCLEGLGVLGLDEATALVGVNGAFDVIGRGTVTVIDGNGITVHRGFAPLDLMAGSRTRVFDLPEARQVPVKPGSRFSRNAEIASLRSLEMRKEEFHWAT